MTVLQALLAVLAVGPVTSHASLQARVYLATALAGIAILYRRGFRGPYSAELALARDYLIELGVIEQELLSTQHTSIFRIAADAFETVAAIQTEAGAEWGELQAAARRVDATCASTDTAALASKIHCALGPNCIAVSDAERYAKAQGWKPVSPESAVELLCELGLASASDIAAGETPPRPGARDELRH